MDFQRPRCKVLESVNGFKLPRITNEMLLVIMLTLGLWPRLSCKKGTGPKKLGLGFKHIFANMGKWKK
jgi:hypothetical protein